VIRRARASGRTVKGTLRPATSIVRVFGSDGRSGFLRKDRRDNMRCW
jgi:hypothetical protein